MPPLDFVEQIVKTSNEVLEDAREAYYAGTPVMEDQLFDALEADLKGLVKANPETAPLATVLETVGTDDSGRIPHKYPMRSIENVFTLEEALQFFRDHPGVAVSLGSKWDGISVDLVYSKGKLVQALTRGDGDAGEDITAQVLASEKIPKELIGFGGDATYIHGELLIASSTMEAMNRKLVAAGSKPFANTRNLVAGTMKLKDTSLVIERRVEFAPFSVLGEGFADDSMQKRLKALTLSGFRPTDEVLVHTEEELKEVLEAKLKAIEEDTEWGRDGVVIKLDSATARERVGVGSKNANYAVAFKPQNLSAETTIKAVEWSTSRGGRLVPVAIMEPITLGGAVVERATLNNYSWIAAMNVYEGCRALCLKSGDIIPKIVTVIDDGTFHLPPKPPTNCPDCGSEVVAYTESKSGIITHWCLNATCPGRVADMLTYVADRTVLEIDNLGPEMASLLTKSGYVLGLADLFEWADEILSGVDKVGPDKITRSLASAGFSSYVTTMRMVYSLQQAKSASWDRWLAALCIPMFGRRLGKVLASTLKLDREDFKDLPAKLRTIQDNPIEGIGPLKLAELIRNIEDPIFVDMTQRLYAIGVRPTPTFVASETSAALEGITFLITGEFFDFGEREYITKKLEALGAVSKSGVSKKVNLLLVGNMPGPSKIAKAASLGIKQVGGEWLNEVFTQNNIERCGVNLEAEFVE